MNKPPEKDEDAALARNVAIMRERMKGEVARLRESLDVWIDENTQHGNDVEITSAMLQTAFEREIELLGEQDAFRLIESAFRRSADKFRRSLQ
jgi:hypothetical protein